MGISWAVILGLDLTFEMGKFILRPGLQLERVVKYTSQALRLFGNYLRLN
jgi:hypothetical protein